MTEILKQSEVQHLLKNKNKTKNLCACMCACLCVKIKERGSDLQANYVKNS